MKKKKTSYYDLRENQEAANDARRKLFYLYDEKYFNLWLNSWKWKGINRDQREFIMRKFWEEGSVAAFSIISPQKTFLEGEAPAEQEAGLLGFAPFSAVGYNMYNYPTAVNLINLRDVPYIPNKILTNGVEVVLGYAQHSRQPIGRIARVYIERLVNIEMTIRTNLIAHKLPFAIEVTPDSKAHAEDLMRAVMNDNPALFVNVGELNSIKGQGALTNYVIDKLYNYKQAVENELLAFLGIDNLGGSQKKEHLITSEVESNNDLINDYSDSIGSNLTEFCRLIGEVLGFSVSVEPTSSPAEAKKDDEEAGEESDEETKGNNEDEE